LGNWKIHDVTEPMTLDGVIELIEKAIEEHGDLPLLVVCDDGAAQDHGRIKGAVAPHPDVCMIQAEWIDLDEADIPASTVTARGMVQNLKRMTGMGNLVTQVQLEGASWPMGGDIRVVFHEEAYGALVLGVEDPEHGCL
jgi:hypothetical protein